MWRTAIGTGFDEIWRYRVPFISTPQEDYVGLPGDEHYDIDVPPEVDEQLAGDGREQGHVIFHPERGELVAWPHDGTGRTPDYLRGVRAEQIKAQARALWEDSLAGGWLSEDDQHLGSVEEGPWQQSGYPNWDTQEVGFAFEGNWGADVHEKIATFMRTQPTQEQFEMWTIENIIGPYNAERQTEAHEWNTIPEHDRLDYSWESLKEKSPGAADLVSQIGGGGNVSDVDLNDTIIDLSKLDWGLLYRYALEDFRTAKTATDEWQTPYFVQPDSVIENAKWRHSCPMCHGYLRDRGDVFTCDSCGFEPMDKTAKRSRVYKMSNDDPTHWQKFWQNPEPDAESVEHPWDENDYVWRHRVPFNAYPDGSFEIGDPGQEHHEMPGGGVLPEGYSQGDAQGGVVFHPEYGEAPQWPQWSEYPEWAEGPPLNPLTPEQKNEILEAARQRYRELGPAKGQWGDHYNDGTKTAMALTPELLQQHMSEHGQYAFHSTAPWYAASAIEQGLLPDSNGAQPSSSPTDWNVGNRRPGRVYMGTEKAVTGYGQGIGEFNENFPPPLRIDMTKLDPQNIDLDEDQVSTNDFNHNLDDWPGFNYNSPEGDDPQQTMRGMAGGTWTHRGVVPPHALDWNPNFVNWWNERGYKSLLDYGKHDHTFVEDAEHIQSLMSKTANAPGVDSWTTPSNTHTQMVDPSGNTDGLDMTQAPGPRIPCYCGIGLNSPHEWTDSCEKGDRPTMKYEAAMGSNWVYIEGQVAFGRHWFQIAQDMLINSGTDEETTSYITNMLARNTLPTDLDCSIGSMRNGRVQIWESTLDRNAVWSAVKDAWDAQQSGTQGKVSRISRSLRIV